jgi:uncharacterized Tic20 family protein
MAKRAQITQLKAMMGAVAVALAGAVIASIDNKVAEIIGIILIFGSVGLFWIFY